MCDHHTRIVNGGSKLPSDSPTIGLLFGVQTNNNITITDAADVIYEIVNGEVILNFQSINRIKALIIGVYPTYDLVGWYTIGTEVTPAHMKIHQNFMKGLNEPLILLMLNPSPSVNSKQLPISIFEEELRKTNDNSYSHIFVEIPLKLETGQVEKISIDQVTKAANISSESTSMEIQNKGMMTSIITFQDKLEYVIKVLTSMKEGRIPHDYELVRKATKILNQLPDVSTSQSVKGNEFVKTFQEDLTECYILSYVAAMVKTTKEINELGRMYHQLDISSNPGSMSSSVASISSSSASRISKLGHH